MAALLYDDVRGLIQNADVMLAQGYGPFSWAIRLRCMRWERWRPVLGRYTHAGFFVWGQFAGRRRLYILEAMEGVGVRVVPFSYYLGHYAKNGGNVEWWKLSGADSERLAIVQHAASFWTGTNNYGYLQLLRTFGGLLRPLWRWLIPPQPDHHYCSHLVAESLLAGRALDRGRCSLAPEDTPPEVIAGFPCLEFQGQVVRGEPGWLPPLALA